MRTKATVPYPIALSQVDKYTWNDVSGQQPKSSSPAPPQKRTSTNISHFKLLLNPFPSKILSVRSSVDIKINLSIEAEIDLVS